MSPRILAAIERGESRCAGESCRRSTMSCDELPPIECPVKPGPYALADRPGARSLDAAGRPEQSRWQSRAHFFGAAAEAMRRILVEHARRKHSQKRGGGAHREELDEAHLVLAAPADELLAVHDALDKLAAEDAPAAELVKLRYFVGMTMEEAAAAIGLPKRTAESLWDLRSGLA